MHLPRPMDRLLHSFLQADIAPFCQPFALGTSVGTWGCPNQGV
jgi:hypothetical protein